MKITEVHAEYAKRKTQYEKLGVAIKNILERKLSEAKMPHQPITSRVKEFDAFIRKANRIETGAPFEDVKDICEVQVVSLFLSDLPRIGEIIKSNFSIHDAGDGIFDQPDAFGYLYVHYIGRLSEQYARPGNDELKGLEFEIQVRTITMQTWTTMVHYLGYKSPLAIPSPLRRDFNALSALLYAADERFEMFFKSSEESKQTAEEKAATAELEMEEINYNTLAVYLLSRYKERKHAEPEMLSILVDELQEVGYKKIQQLDELLRRAQKAFEAFEKDHAAEGQEHGLYSDAGAVRIAVSIGDESYLANRHVAEEVRERRRAYRHLVE